MSKFLLQAQVGLLIILVAAMIDFVIGSFITPNNEEFSKGFVGYNSMDLLRTGGFKLTL